MKKVYIIYLLLIAPLFALSQSKSGYHVKNYHDLPLNVLSGKLKAAKSDTERMNLLNTMIFSVYNTYEDDSYDFDTSAIHKLIALNKKAGLINDQPYETLLLVLRAHFKHDYVKELSSSITAINEFDHEYIDAADLLIGTRWIFNVTNRQEEKYIYYTKKLNGYLQQKNYINAAACYHCLAGYYVFKGDLNSAINNYMKAEELFKPYTKFWYINEICVEGDNYVDWGNKKKGLFYEKKGLNLQYSAKIDVDVPYTLDAISYTEYEIKHYKESLKYLDTLQIWDKKLGVGGDTRAELLKTLNYIALNRLGDAYAILEKIKKDTAQSVLQLISNNGTYPPEYAFYKYYLALKNYPKAEQYLLQTYGMAQKYAPKSQTMKYLMEFAQYYADRGNDAKAWHYTSLYNKMNDSLQAKTDSFKIASYENEQKENAQNSKLVDMQQQQAVQDATIKQRNVVIWVSMIGLLIVCVSIVFIYRQLQTNKKTLISLRQTQTQLIQSEKMASLGELTAGIAHEIQNPLNFVNNFSEVSIELLDELKEEAQAGHTDDVIAIATDLTQNLEKINHHGKRADSIVKGMLEHSRVGSGEKQLVDLNALADEFLKLSYHGLRAKDKNFNAELITKFDENLPKVNIVQQDIGRVLLNLFNNAFYAVNQKQKTAGPDYKPEVTVSTSTEKNNLVIIVKDNGNGIPDAIKEKIMQPFFTTKPTGEGTGLGLSLSYDIVVKGHGGSITVDTKEGEGSAFIITIPL
jgi:signal transduction histidine kinase